MICRIIYDSFRFQLKLIYLFQYDDGFHVRTSVSFRAHHVAAFEGMLVSGLCDSLCKRIGVTSEIRLTLLLATFFLATVAARKEKGSVYMNLGVGTWDLDLEI